MSFSEETKQIMKHYLELYLKGTIIREEQDVLDAYVEEIKNSTNPEDIAFVSTYQGKVNKTREETLTKDEVLDQLQMMTEKQLKFLLKLSQKLFLETNAN